MISSTLSPGKRVQQFAESAKQIGYVTASANQNE